MQEYCWGASSDCLQIGDHDLFNPADFCIFEQLIHIELFSGSIEFQSLQHNVHADFVAILEAVGKGFFRVIDFHWHPVDTMNFDTCRIGLLREFVGNDWWSIKDG